MAVLDKGLKQRIVGALVLVALAVIFLPMLFSREDELRQVTVDAPAMPDRPSMPDVALEPVVVPEPVAEDEVPPVEPVPQTSSEPIAAPTQPVAEPQVQAQVQTPPPAETPAPTQAATKPASGLDANNLPVSWSVQLASLSSRAGAEKLQQTLRSGGYNAYIRSFDGMNRVFVGPVIERAEADRLRDLLNRQQNLKGFVVRFQPENG
ncbi:MULTISPECIES: SPOR domain-containing protein [unclassified Pseudomonas]|uniref:SPOR domain-containing protein n=1 Tax=unclassified Pseudomonas TaxID=196821 RepID=UPI0024469C5C|nr:MULTISPECIES: SPOR domain-containing protein [unclassified Pseudomonas]MDG9922869.1 SPOR domain-containing protein [Pseudomonas sp. GD04045]MDH0036850.1 SPOR domain-containing protein [Pseudomonas sp. GD04019]